MPTIRKLTLRHAVTKIDEWCEIADGVRLMLKINKSERNFDSPIFSYSEQDEHSKILNTRLAGNTSKYNAPSVYFCEIRDGFISPRMKKLPRYWVFGNKTHYIEDFLYSAWRDHIPEGMTVTDSEDSEFLDINLSRCIHANKPVVFLNFFNNTNHLLHESLPTLLYLEELTKDYPDCLFYSSPLKPYVKRFLFDIGFPVEKIIEIYDTAISAPLILLPCFAGGGHLNNPTSDLDRTCNLLSDLLPQTYKASEKPKYIFVSRSDATQRMLLNEDEVVKYLKSKLDFKVVIPGSLSLSQQIEYFSSAKIVIGPHGMGINNFAFAKKPKLLMELFQPNWVREAYYRQAQIKEAAYAAYIGQSVDGNLLIDMPQFADFFEKCLNSIAD